MYYVMSSGWYARKFVTNTKLQKVTKIIHGISKEQNDALLVIFTSNGRVFGVLAADTCSEIDQKIISTKSSTKKHELGLFNFISLA